MKSKSLLSKCSSDQLSGSSYDLLLTDVNTEMPGVSRTATTPDASPLASTCSTSSYTEPMAIVGLSMRLPGRVRNAEQFWDLLAQKRSGQCTVPDDRYNISGFYSPCKRQGTLGMRQGYFLDDIDLPSLDTSMFSMSKSELRRLDPQQRQLLEVAYECMENAGQTGWRGKKIGCYIGVFGEDWLDLYAKETQHRNGYRVTGYGDFVLGNRISYEFDLRGPSMTVKTGCSSSLVSLDLACQAIQKGDCTAALVGGTSLIFSPTMTMALSDQGVLSASGSCKTFDASADGYGRGEAVNMILIKKLSDAIRDGDGVRAVIRAAQVNCDGHTNGMITPSTEAQEALIRSAYRLAGLSEYEMSRTAFVECHGTGTAVGDPAEAKAVARCFGEQGVIITSVKPNVGHSEGAAGITSLIKGVLALEHRLVPPNINFTNPNPDIPFKAGKLRVPIEVEQWPEGRDERVSINSFGIGGVNAHVILESPRQYAISNAMSCETMPFQLLELGADQDAQLDPITMEAAEPTDVGDMSNLQRDQSHLLLFSAASIPSLQAQISAFQEYTKRTQASLSDVAYSLACRRERHRYCTYAIASAAAPSWVAAAIQDSRSFPSSSPSLLSSSQENIFWVFTGQGAQWPGMGAVLLETSAIFAKTIHKLDSYLQSLSSPPPWLIADELRKVSCESTVSNIIFGHPLSTAVQIALVNVLRSWAVKPSAVLGHSSGEIAAAYASGAITAEAAILTALRRGSIDKSSTKGGSMAAVGLGRDHVAPFLQPGVVVACENSHCSVTLSGDANQLNRTIAEITEAFTDVFSRHLHVEAAFHSHHVLEYGAPYQEALESVVTSIDPQVPFYSSVSGSRLAGDGCLDASYWRRNMEEPVLFNSCLRSALRDHGKRLILIEIGAHPALHGPIAQILRDSGRSGDVCLSTLRRNQDCHDSLLHLAGKLVQQGVSIDRSAICPPGRLVADLPTYRWTRSSTVHWEEPRVAREWRFRKHPPHELLGSQVLETSSEPRWRNMLSLEQSPWLAGHRINGSIVFPAAGYIAMIGEALRQLEQNHGPDQDRAYCIRNLQISAALMLDEDAGAATEVSTTLTPVMLDASEQSPWYAITISSCDGSKWTRHCTAEAKISLEEPFFLASSELESCAFPRQVDARHWYKVLRNAGFSYTGCFEALRDVTAATTSQSAQATVDHDDVHGSGLGGGLSHGADRYAVHPAVIDQCFQLCTVATSNGLGRNCSRMALPTFIEEIVISPRRRRADSPCPAAQSKLSITACISSAERASYTSNIVARTLDNSSAPVMSFKGFKATILAGTANSHAMSRSSTDVQPHELLLSSVQWLPHAEFTNLGSHLRTAVARSTEWPLFEELAILSMIYIRRVYNIQACNPAESHLTKLLVWTQTVIAKYQAGKNIFVSAEPGLCHLSGEEVYARMRHIADQVSTMPGSNYSAISTAIMVLTENVADIFAGKSSPLNLLLNSPQDNLLGRIYSFGENVSKSRALSILANTNPRLRVLEIGAGTGGTTATVLAMLKSSYGERLYASYTYTDISAGFLAAAKQRFSEASNMNYATLDISNPPEAQGFELGAYDLIIASNVIHATPSLYASLCNVRKLLAPRGHLFLQELCPDAIFIDYIMGFLPGWWLGADDNRSAQPYVSPERWTRELLSAGFQTPDAISLDVHEPYQASAIILAAAAPQTQTEAPAKPVTILCYSAEGPYVSDLRNVLEGMHISVGICTFGEAPPLSHDIISLIDLETPLVHDGLTEKSFALLLGYFESLCQQQNLIWVTRSSQVATQDPRCSMILGLVRSCRTEMRRRIVTAEVDVATGHASASMALSSILLKMRRDAAATDAPQRTKSDLSSSVTKLDPDWEYAIDNGEVLVPRFHWHTLQSYRSAFSCRSSAISGQEQVKDDRLWRHLDIPRPGLLHTMGWAETSFPPDLKPNHVIVKVKAVGVNFRDVLIALGVLDNATSEMGLEGSGYVEAVGRDVTDLAPGDRVMYLSRGCFSTYMTLPQLSCVKLDGSMSYEAAAALPCAYATAVVALVDKANLQKAQSVLIHSAAGGVGLAAIQVAKLIGAKIYCTVGNDEKAQYLEQHHHIPRSSIFHSRDASFQRDVMQATNQRGVDVVLNSLSGDLLHASWECVSEFGTMVEIGKRDFRRRAKLSMGLFEKNRTFVGLDLFSMSLNRPEITQRILLNCLDWIRQRNIIPDRIGHIIPASNVCDAFRVMQNGQHIGKLVITMPDEPCTLKYAPAQPKPSFKPDRSYLLVGGLGGLGRGVSTWMVEAGARSLVFLSRTCTTEAALKFQVELQSYECQVQLIQGDIANPADVERALRSAPASKPIAGVMNLSMVLRDVPLSSMTYDDWIKVTRPKVQGTWNLHNAVSALALDFFILFSSYSGVIGARGQGNYAAANTFLDSFVQYRHSLGLAASVVDIGCVGDIGTVALNPDLYQHFERVGLYLLKEKQLLDVLTVAVELSQPPSTPDEHPQRRKLNHAYTQPSQITFGLATAVAIDSPRCLVSWKHDSRVAIYHNVNCAIKQSDPGPADSDGSDSSSGLRRLLRSLAESADVILDQGMAARIADTVRDELCVILTKQKDMIHLDHSTASIGVDSLIAIELRNWIAQQFQVDVSVFTIVQSSSLVELGESIRIGLAARLDNKQAEA